MSLRRFAQRPSRPSAARLPANFTWGVATSAYQIEGAWNRDGKGPSIWDTFTHESRGVFGNQNADVACDHYRRWREDVALMRRLGMDAYRFSIAWTRIQPEGTGRVNRRGLGFYDRLVDELLAQGITPWVTLYHWDLPQALQNLGGLRNREFVEWFGDYAALVAQTLGDRVRHWITVNEPQVVTGYGLHDGTHAPGLKLPYAECLLAAHHLLMGHRRAVQALRAHAGGATARISLANCGPVSVPASTRKRDVEAARQHFFAATKPDMWNLAWWADPIVFGHYPADGVEAHRDVMPEIRAGDMELIAQPIDFLAHNCYTGLPIRADAHGQPERRPGGWGDGNPRGTLAWLEIVDDVLYWAARFQHERYQLPVAFTESGFCNTDFVHLDGKVHDPQRIDFLRRQLRGLRRAVAEGVPVEGYFEWSLLDNFEWAEGFKDRFGLVHVDFQTQVRTPKDSFAWYRDVIRTNGSRL